MENKYEILIIGAGPAGLTAGLYAARAGRRVAVIEEMLPGGQITQTELLENYPGFDEGIGGFELGEKIEKQAKKFGLEVINDTVEQLSLTGDTKVVKLTSVELLADTIILAMGARPKKTGIPSEHRLAGAGVSYCAVCDGALYRDADVAVIGGGDTAVSDALYLSKFAKKVYLVHRRHEFRASKTLVDAAAKQSNIEFVMGYVPHEFLGKNGVEGLAVSDRDNGTVKVLSVSGIFVAVGTEPRSELVSDMVAIDDKGYIVTDNHMKTSIDGVFAAGDIRVTPLRQVVTAAADGAVAATFADEYLSAK